jgi:hypothetical protein
METEVWDAHREMRFLIQSSTPLTNSTGEIIGTVVLFRDLEKIKAMPEYDETNLSAVYQQCVQSFTANAEKVQQWAQTGLSEYNEKCQKLNPADLAVEAVTVEEKIKNEAS